MEITIGEIDGAPFKLDVQRHLIDRGLAIIGMRASGKSYCIGTIPEELAEIGQPFLVVDLMGEYFSLKEIYPAIVVSLGGEEYADIKSTKPTMAKAIAEVVLETGQNTVIDLKAGTMLEKYKFLAEFLPAFYNKAKQVNRPIVLVLDEAHQITPEKSLVKLKEVKEYQDKVIYWIYEIAATGRHYGIGYIAAARRDAEVAKSTINQCELRINFKVIGIDIDYLSKRIPTEFLRKIERLKAGEGVILGLEAPVIVRISARKCTHKGGTPVLKPVSIPKLEEFTSRLAKITEEIKVREAEPETLKRFVEKQERKIEELKSKISNLEAENSSLKIKIEELKRQLQKAPPDLELRIEMLKDDLATAKERIKELEAKNTDLEQQLSEASKLEEQIGRMREAIAGFRDFIIDFSDAFNLDLIPKDVLEWKRRAEEAEEKLAIYEKTEQERELRMRETFKDKAVQNWIRNAKNHLYNLKMRRGAFPKVLQQVVAYHPNVVFNASDFNVGVTVDTVKDYLKELQSLRLVIEDRSGYKNGIHLWITTNVRKIKPMAPDNAINQIANELIDYVLSI